MTLGLQNRNGYNIIIKSSFFLPLYLIFKHTFLDLNIRPEFSYRSERDSGGAVLRSLAHVNSLKRGVRMTKSRSIANLSGM